MEIPKEYPNFENERALILVTGNKAADIYLATKKELQKVEEYRENIPHYSDREEYFQTGASRDNVYGSGSVYESKEDEVETRLLNHLKERLLLILNAEAITSIYVISPDYFSDRVKTTIPKVHLEKLRLTITENIAGKHPMDVLKAIKKEQGKNTGQKVPIKNETRKLLEKADTIKNVLGKKSTKDKK